MAFCLPQTVAQDFIRKVKEKKINPFELMKKTSSERRAFFEEFMSPENAKQTNALFESKVVLKNQVEGMKNWIKQTAGIKPELQRDMLAKVGNITNVLKPKNLDMFLEDFAEQRLGVGITADEAGKIADLSRIVAEKRAAMEAGGDRMEYGRALVSFNNYVSALKLQAQQKPLGERVLGYIKNPWEGLVAASGQAKGINASMDNSAVFRQGWKTMMTNPVIWGKNAAQSFVNLAKTVKDGDLIKNEVLADIWSRPNAKLYKKEKLAIGNLEEAYPSTLPEKIPVLGRLYKASETAYTTFLYRMRADLFDKYVEIAKKTGGDMTGVGRVINSLTGRANLGKFEPAAEAINNIFFSPRFIKSHIDVLTGHVGDGKIGKFGKKQARRNLLKIIGGTAAIMAIANWIRPGSAELDPRSANFGKIKVGDTTYDITGGMGSIVTLASRIATLSTKNKTTGEIQPLNSGKFGEATAWDLLMDFGKGKLSPTFGLVRDLMTGQDYDGNPVTVQSGLSSLFVPLPIKDAIKQFEANDNDANALLNILLSGVGITTTLNVAKAKGFDLKNPDEKMVNTEFNRLAKYDLKPEGLNIDNPEGRLLELQEQIGTEKYEEAKKYLKNIYFNGPDGNNGAVQLIETQNYKDKSEDIKQKMLNAQKDRAVNLTLGKYKFKPTKPERVYADEEVE